MGRGTALPLFIVLSTVVLVGCVTAPGNGTDTTPPTTTKTGQTSQTTIGQDLVSDEDAKDRALRAEEHYLSTRLRNATCLKDWGTTPSTTQEEATVLNRTSDGVIVEVTHPYWYTTGSTHADGGSHARYRVTPGETERLDGTEIDPC